MEDIESSGIYCTIKMTAASGCKELAITDGPDGKVRISIIVDHLSIVAEPTRYVYRAIAEVELEHLIKAIKLVKGVI